MQVHFSSFIQSVSRWPAFVPSGCFWTAFDSFPFNSFSLNIKDSPPPSPSSLKRQFVIHLSHLSHLSRHSHHDGCVHGFCPLSCMWCVISFCCMGYTLVTVERSGHHCSEPKNLFARLGWTFSLFQYCLEHDAMVI